MTTEVAKDQDGVNWCGGDGQNQLALAKENNGRQSNEIRRLAKYGIRLDRPLKFFSRHLLGFVVVNLFVFSGIVAIAAGAAFLMRYSYSPGWMERLAALGFDTDISRPFFPAFLALWIWLISLAMCGLIRSVGNRSSKIHEWCYVLLLTTLGFGILTLLGVKDMGTLLSTSTWGMPQAVAERLDPAIHWISSGLTALLAMALIPYLNIPALLRSGAQPTNKLEHTVFRVAAYAAVIGAPMFLFYLLAQENLSGKSQATQFSDYTIRDPRNFWGRIENEGAEGSNHPRHVIASRLLDATQEEDRQELMAAWDRIESDAQAHGVLEQFFDGVFYMFGRNDYRQRVLNWEQFHKLRGEIADDINTYCLSDPTFLFQETTPALRNANHLFVLQLLPFWTNGTPTWRLDKMLAEPTTVDSNLETMQRLGIERSQREAFNDARATLKRTADEWKSVRIIHFPAESTQQSRFDVKPQNDNAKDSRIWSLLWQSLLTKVQNSSQKEDSTNAIRKTELKTESTVSDSLEEGQKRPGPSKQYLDRIDVHFDKQLGLIEKNSLQEEAELGALIKAHDTLVEELKKASSSSASNPTLLSEIKTYRVQRKRLADEIRLANWQILTMLYPQYVRGPESVFARDVNENDQAARRSWMLIAGASFLAIGLLFSFNATSMHGYYRDVLTETWLRGRDMTLTELETCHVGGPLHIFNATINLFAKKSHPDLEGMSRFTMSPIACGSSMTGYPPPDDVESGDITVGDAIAISGAAVTPTATPNLLFRIILFLTNFRLGRWVRNPKAYEPETYYPAFLRLLVNMIWSPEDRSYCFLSDGGHLENTGIATLLERRCRLIIAVDGSQDSDGLSLDLVRLIQAARWKYGTRIEPLEGFDKASGRFAYESKSDHKFASDHFFVARILYPDDDQESPATGYLIVAKPSLSGDEPVELLKYRQQSPDFPQHPTSDQFFDPVRFEMYLHLGNHIGDQLVALLEDAQNDRRDGDRSKLNLHSWAHCPDAGKPVATIDHSREPFEFDKDPEFNDAAIERAGEVLRTGSADQVHSVMQWANHYEGHSRPLRVRFLNKLEAAYSNISKLCQDNDLLLYVALATIAKLGGRSKQWLDLQNKLSIDTGNIASSARKNESVQAEMEVDVQGNSGQ